VTRDIITIDEYQQHSWQSGTSVHHSIISVRGQGRAIGNNILRQILYRSFNIAQSGLPNGRTLHKATIWWKGGLFQRPMGIVTGFHILDQKEGLL